MLRRSVLSVLVPLLAAATLPAQQESKMAPAKIVFVCEHGAAKSVIAAKELEKLARERGISLQAVPGARRRTRTSRSTCARD